MSAPGIASPPPGARPVDLRPPQRWSAMGRTAMAMLLHDRIKLAGILAGVVISVVLSNQQGAIFLGIVHRNLLMVENAGADIWITAPGARMVQPGPTFSERVLHRARATSGVEWASPLLLGSGAIQLPQGGSEQLVVVGVELPERRGGPFGVVLGEPESLAHPEAMFFEDSDREKFGGINLGSVQEVNGRRVQAVGFTWGMLPMGPSYAFSGLETARRVLGSVEGEQTHVMVRLAPGVDVDTVVAELRAALPYQQVLSREEFARITTRYILLETPVGTTLGVSTLFGLVVGFVIVALTVFSSVVDHLREFGTLKAIGATNGDLTRLLVVQATLVAIVGTVLGEGLVSVFLGWMRSPRLAVSLPGWMVGGTFVLMLLICIGASGLALVRLRKLEPAMVFR